MIPKDETLYDQLIGYLAARGAVREDARRGVLVLSEFDHRPLPAPLHLHVSPDILGDHLRASAPAAAGSYPDVHPVEAAWRLFLVHLADAVATAEPGETELVLDDTGVLARPPAA